MKAWALGALLVGCGGSTPASDARSDAHGATACVAWTGEPIALVSVPGTSAHHPSVIGDADTISVAWQRGKGSSQIYVQPFTQALTPKGDATLTSASQGRATHPQLAAAPDGQVLVYTDEMTGSTQVVSLLADGRPAAPRRTLPAAQGGAQAYPDVVVDGAGTPHILWSVTGSTEGWARLSGQEAPAGLPTTADHPRGGPGTVVLSRSGTPLFVWPERDVDPKTGSGKARIHMLGADDVRHTLWESSENLQRTTAARLDDRLVVGWTRYPTATSPWGVGLGLFDAHGVSVRPPAALGSDGARMLDLDAHGDHIVAAWEAPAGARQATVIHVQRLDRDGRVACAPTTVHGADGARHARASVALWPAASGTEGVVVWQRGDARTDAAIWGRRFRLPR